MNTIKEQLYQYCKSYLTERIASFQAAIEAARQTASQETKSSMGDKYETTRAMMQIEIEKNERQLAETLKLKEVLHKINPKSISTLVALGSLVRTGRGSYYEGSGLGKVVVDNKPYFVVSPASPIGQQLMGLKAGDTATHNNNTIDIQEVT